MDAKMRANFINSVGGGQKIPCPSCNALNDADSNFCMTCGTKLNSVPAPASETETAPAFSSAKEDVTSETVATSEPNVVKRSEKKLAFKFVEPVIEDDEEPTSVFAQGLPSWDVVPPQVVVRRKAKR